MILTDKQAAVLNYLVEYRRKHGYQPSTREIGDHMGTTSPNSVQQHINLLCDRGFISRECAKARAVEFVPSVWEAIGFWLPIRGKIS